MPQWEGSILQSRRLKPKDNVREEGVPNSYLPLRSPRPATNSNHKLNLANHSQNQILIDKSQNKHSSTLKNKKFKPPRIPFSSKPFYKQMKPHITQHKKVRYMHLESETSKKELPKDDYLGMPRTYPTSSSDAPTTDAGKDKGPKEKTPLRLNQIFSPDDWQA